MTEGMNRRNFMLTAAAGIGAGMVVGCNSGRKISARPSINRSVAGLAVEPLDVVRIGIIGVGGRGRGHLGHYLKIEGTQIKAIADNHAPAALASQKRCIDAGFEKPDIYTNGDFDYRRMLERSDIDAVMIFTPWRWHTPMAVDAMNAGKHAFMEVPAAVTLEQCWQLVDTSEKTQKHCMMMENVCYGREELMALNMARLGIFGDLLHGECAYIHDLRGQMNSIKRGTGSWRTLHHITRNGNLYPTHGLGPISQYMNINRGDRFDYLTSMSSPALGRAAFAKKKFPPDHMRNQAKYICGDMNTTLIKTALGRSVMVQHDTTSPRPYSRINLIQGTKGTLCGYPNRVTIEGRGGTHNWQDWAQCQKDFDHPLWKSMGEIAKKAGGHGGMDFIMNWRIIYCLRNGLPLDQDVYDAASWSAVGPLSEMSVADRSTSIDFPDFTRGAYKTSKPLGIITV